MNDAVRSMTRACQGYSGEGTRSGVSRTVSGEEMSTGMACAGDAHSAKTWGSHGGRFAG